MADSPESAFDTATRIAAGDDGTTYDRVSVWLHWATALLVVTQFALGETWDWFPKPARQIMESTHMSFGVVLSAVIVARIMWRLMPGHEVSVITRGWVRLASKGVHYVLYLLLVTEAALGFAFRWGADRPMTFFGLGIPPVIGQMSQPVRHQLRELHHWIGWAIIGIALLHALGALYHHYVLKDRVLERMLPGGARG